MTNKADAAELFEKSRKMPTDLAVKALKQVVKLDPAHSEAYKELSHLADDPEMAVFYLRQASKIDEAAMKSTWPDWDGAYQDHPETMAYLSTITTLAVKLFDLGLLEETIELFEKIVQIDQNDTRGAREELARLYFDQGQDGKLMKLLERFPEEKDAGWLYLKALAWFRKFGDSLQTIHILHQAFQANSFFPRYLDLELIISWQTPTYVRVGSREEAINLAKVVGEYWSRDTSAYRFLLETWYDYRDQNDFSEVLLPNAGMFYVIRATVEDLPDVPVWRVFNIPSIMPLSDVHSILQGAFLFDDLYPWAFQKGNESYLGKDFVATEDLDSTSYSHIGYQLNDLLQKPGDTVRYDYLYQDPWHIRLELLAVQTPEEVETCPAILEGMGNAPLERIGPKDWNEYAIAILQKQEKGEDTRSLYNPFLFNLTKANLVFAATSLNALGLNPEDGPDMYEADFDDDDEEDDIEKDDD